MKFVAILSLCLYSLISSSGFSSEDNKDQFNQDKDAHYSEMKDSYYKCFDSLEEAESYNREQKIIGALDDEKIIHSNDRRKRLNESVEDKAHSFNFYLEIYYKNINGLTKTYYGSASLVAPNILLTAGHNLYDSEDGGYPDRVDCFRACYRNKVLAQATVFPNLDPGSLFVHPKYIDSQKGAYARYLNSEHKDKLPYKKYLASQREEETYKFSASDIGLIIFDQKTAQEFKGQSFAIPLKRFCETVAEAQLLKKRFTITGYPGERCAYSMTGKIKGFDQEQSKVWYDIDTDKGQSGSGICFTNGKGDQEKMYCIGVHVCAGRVGEPFNIGVLIDEEMSSIINKYLMTSQ